MAAPDQGELLKGMFYPYCEGCGSKELLQAVGLIGALIQPHNLYLHSALVKVNKKLLLITPKTSKTIELFWCEPKIIFYFQSRELDRTDKGKLRDANFYFFIEAAIALFVSFLINVFVLGVFAHGLAGKTNNEIVSTFSSCQSVHFVFFLKYI